MPLPGSNASVYATAMARHYSKNITGHWYAFTAGEAAAIAARYNPWTGPNARTYGGDAAAAFVSADADYAVTCPTLALASALAGADAAAARGERGNGGGDERSGSGARDVWAYFYAHLHATDVALNVNLTALPPPPPGGARARAWASHASDLAMVFGTHAGPRMGALTADATTPATPLASFNYTPADAATSETMMRFWAQFAAGADPNARGGRARSGAVDADADADADGAPFWPRVTSAFPGSEAMWLSPDARAVLDHKAEDCAFWCHVARNLTGYSPWCSENSAPFL